MAGTLNHLLDSGGDLSALVRDREQLRAALKRVKAHRAARPDCIDRRAFVESAVNQIVSKRFAKRQQMQWSKQGALVLQTRTQVLDDRLERTFRNWYPGFRTEPQQKAA